MGDSICRFHPLVFQYLFERKKSWVVTTLGTITYPLEWLLGRWFFSSFWWDMLLPRRVVISIWKQQKTTTFVFVRGKTTRTNITAHGLWCTILFRSPSGPFSGMQGLLTLVHAAWQQKATKNSWFDIFLPESSKKIISIIFITLSFKEKIHANLSHRRRVMYFWVHQRQSHWCTPKPAGVAAQQGKVQISHGDRINGLVISYL